MLAIRMQRTGRSGHAQFRVIVQDARSHPKSGRVVEYLGSYNPHTKVASIEADKIKQYMQNGAQPSETVVKLLKKEGVKVPAWAAAQSKKERTVKSPEKLRRNRPAGEPAPEPEAQAEAPAETTDEAVSAPEAEPAGETTVEEPVAEQATTSEPQAETVTEPATDDPKDAPDAGEKTSQDQNAS